MSQSAESQIKLVITGESSSAASALEKIDQLARTVGENISRMASQFAESGAMISRFGTDISGTKSELSGVSSSITRLGNNVDTQAQKIAEGTTSISESLMKIGTSASETAGNVSRSATTMVEDFAKIAPAASEAAAGAGRSLRQLTTDEREAGAATKSMFGGHMDGLIGLQLIGGAAVSAGAKLGQLFVGSIKSAMDYQSQMSRVKASLLSTGGVTQDQLNQLGNLAMNLSQTTLYSSNDILTSISTMAKQGLTFKDIYGGAAQAVTTLAQATDTDLGTTATTLTDILHEFGLSGSQLTPVVNGISAAMHTANVSMQDVYNSMKFSAPVASQLGVSVGDLSQMIGLLAQHGIKGSMAGTSLRRMLIDLQPSTKAATAEFQQLGLITKSGSNLFYDASGHLKSMGNVIQILRSHLEGLNAAQKQAALRSMFGVYSLSAMEVVAGTTTQKWNQLTKAMQNTHAATVASEKMDNVSAHIHIFETTLTTIGTKIATFLLPTIDKIIGSLTQLANWFQNLSPNIQHVILLAVGAGAAFLTLGGSLAMARATMGFMLPGFKMIGEGLTGLMSPWGLLIAAIAVGVVLLITHWTQVNNFVQQHFGVTIPQILNGLATFFTTAFHTIESVVTTVWNTIRSVTIAVWNYIGPTIMSGIAAVTNWWSQHWTSIQNAVKIVFTALGVLFATIFSPWIAGIIAIVGALSNSWGQIWDTIRDALKLVWDAMVLIVKTAWDLLSGIIGIALDLLSGKWGQAWTDLKTMLINVWHDMTDGVYKILGDFVHVVMDTVNTLIHGITGAFSGLVNTVKGIWNSIVGIFGQKLPTPQVPNVPAPSYSGSTSEPKIPHFGVGGLVKAPTIALIGESGPEMVLPLNGINQSSSNYTMGLNGVGRVGTGLGGNGVRIENIYVTVPNGDPKTIAASLKTQISRAIS